MVLPLLRIYCHTNMRKLMCPQERWLDKASPCRCEEWWRCPENPGGLHVPSWESGNRGCPCPVSAAWHNPMRNLVFSWRAESQVRYAYLERNFGWFQVPIFIKRFFSSPGYKLRQCFQNSLIGAVTRLIISGNDEYRVWLEHMLMHREQWRLK